MHYYYSIYAHEWSVTETLPAGKLSGGKLPAGKLPVRKIASAENCQLGKLPVRKFYELFFLNLYTCYS